MLGGREERGHLGIMILEQDTESKLHPSPPPRDGTPSSAYLGLESNLTARGHPRKGGSLQPGEDGPEHPRGGLGSVSGQAAPKEGFLVALAETLW